MERREVVSVLPAPAGFAAADRRTLSIFAPGGYEVDPQRLATARRYFEARGYEVVEALASSQRHQRFSGTDDERLGWLAALAEGAAAVDIALALRGGYGATRLLPRIDFHALSGAVARGTRFVGHSDFTAIGLALLATTGATSFAGPMASFGFGRDEVEPFTEAQFWRAMESSTVDLAFDTPFTGTVEARGTLWGGNLAMLTSLMGTPWLPAIDGGILFVEDVNEPPYRVERMLLQLVQAGVIGRQRAVLVGDITGFRTADYDNGYGVADALAYVQSTTPVPIVAGLPFGHGSRTATLAVGVAAGLTAADGRCRLRQSW